MKKSWYVEIEEGCGEVLIALEDLVKVVPKGSKWFCKNLDFTILEARLELRDKPLELNWDTIHKAHRQSGFHFGANRVV